MDSRGGSVVQVGVLRVWKTLVGLVIAGPVKLELKGARIKAGFSNKSSKVDGWMDIQRRQQEFQAREASNRNRRE